MCINLSIRINAFFYIILISYLYVNNLHAQQVTEPPIPIYIVCPYHQDSLKNVSGNSVGINGQAFSYALNKYDTLQVQIQKSSAENTAHFTWLYTLIALLGTMNLVLLFSTSRIRKELSLMKHLEHKQMLPSIAQADEIEKLHSVKARRKTEKLS